MYLSSSIAMFALAFSSPAVSGAAASLKSAHTSDMMDFSLIQRKLTSVTNTLPVTSYKLQSSRFLQDENSEDLMCFLALFGMMGEGDESGENVLEGLNDIVSEDLCDQSTYICDGAPLLDSAKAACDVSNGIIVMHDLVLCEEDMMSDDPTEAGPPSDLTLKNIPICVPSVCPDDTNVFTLVFSLLEGLSEELGEGTGEDMALPKAFTGEDCDSGLSTTISAAGTNKVGSFLLVASVVTLANLFF